MNVKDAEMTNLKDVIDIFVCPRCGGALKFSGNFIICTVSGNHTYPIINNIPRFVESLHYTYESHWKRFSSEQPNKLKLEQAEKFINWLKENNSITGVVLDLGCGDGNHVPFIPDDVLYIAVDCTSVVDVVFQKYRNRSNLVIVQANALNLPFKDNYFDCVFSYSCINYLPDIRKAISEIERIVKEEKRYALWGYCTDNKLLRNSIALARKTYKVLPEPFKPMMLHMMVLGLVFIPNTTGINPFRSTWKQCCEIVSTNLSPELLTILDKDGWDKYVSRASIKIAEYTEKAGAIFQKSGH